MKPKAYVFIDNWGPSEPKLEDTEYDNNLFYNSPQSERIRTKLLIERKKKLEMNDIDFQKTENSRSISSKNVEHVERLRGMKLLSEARNKYKFGKRVSEEKQEKESKEIGVNINQSINSNSKFIHSKLSPGFSLKEWGQKYPCGYAKKTSTELVAKKKLKISAKVQQMMKNLEEVLFEDRLHNNRWNVYHSLSPTSTMIDFKTDTFLENYQNCMDQLSESIAFKKKEDLMDEISQFNENNTPFLFLKDAVVEKSNNAIKNIKILRKQQCISPPTIFGNFKNTIPRVKSPCDFPVRPWTGDHNSQNESNIVRLESQIIVNPTINTDEINVSNQSLSRVKSPKLEGNNMIEKFTVTQSGSFSPTLQRINSVKTSKEAQMVRAFSPSSKTGRSLSPSNTNERVSSPLSKIGRESENEQNLMFSSSEKEKEKYNFPFNNEQEILEEFIEREIIDRKKLKVVLPDIKNNNKLVDMVVYSSLKSNTFITESNCINMKSNQQEIFEIRAEKAEFHERYSGYEDSSGVMEWLKQISINSSNYHYCYYYCCYYYYYCCYYYYY